jgi:rhodanese-related sulfurtransferase
MTGPQDGPGRLALIKKQLGFLQTGAETIWKEEKKKASKAGVDVSVFDDNLGPAFHKLAVVLTAAHKSNAPNVPAIKAQKDKVANKLTGYAFLCRSGMRSDAAHRAAWQSLLTTLTSMNALLYQATDTFLHETQKTL